MEACFLVCLFLTQGAAQGRETNSQNKNTPQQIMLAKVELDS